MNNIFIPVVTLSVVAGCVIGSALTVPIIPVSLLLLAVSASLFLARENRHFVLTFACAVALFIGMIRVTGGAAGERTITTDFPGNVLVHGVITGDIEHRESYSRYAVAVETVNGNVPADNMSVLVYEPYPSQCVTGEEMSFSGKMLEPSDFVTDTGRVFPYRHYLRQFNIRAISFARTVSCDGKADRIALFASLRQRFVSAMHDVLPTREASLLGGLLLGLRGLLPQDILDAFRTTGLIHIIVLSGYNVTLVAEAVRRVTRRSGTAVSSSVALVTIIVFVLLAGAQTAALRAGIMAIVALAARSMHREYDGIRALLFVAAAMVLINPDQVLFNISFHLSFLATLGLLMFSPILEQSMRRVPDRFGMRSIIAATVSTQFILLPYLAYAIGEVSLVGVVANIVILPIIPVAMATGAAVTLTALIAPAIGLLVMPIAYLPLHAMISIASFLAQVPYASVTLPAFSAIWATGATAVIVIGGGLVMHAMQRKRPEG